MKKNGILYEKYNEKNSKKNENEKSGDYKDIMVSTDGKTYMPMKDPNDVYNDKDIRINRSSEFLVDNLSWSKRDPNTAMDRYVYGYIHICIYIYTYIYIYIYVYTYMYTYVNTYTCIKMHIKRIHVNIINECFVRIICHGLREILTRPWIGIFIHIHVYIYL
jgi:hypothetical protein